MGTSILVNRAIELNEEGGQLLRDGHLVEASFKFSRALFLNPNNAEYYRNKGDVMFNFGDFISAIDHYEESMSLKKSDDIKQSLLNANYLFAHLLMEEKNFARALVHFKKMDALTPDVPHILSYISLCQLAVLRYDDALLSMNRCIELDPEEAEWYIMRSKVYRALNELNKEFEDMKTAIQIDPNHPESVKIRNRMTQGAGSIQEEAARCVLSGNIREATARLSYAISLNPMDASHYILRGSLYRKQDDFNAAIDDYNQAVDICVQADLDLQENLVYRQAVKLLCLTYNDFAVECFKAELFSEAIILLNKALGVMKTEKQLYINRGDCFRALEDLHFALADYMQAAELDSDDWSIRSRCALMFNRFGVIEFSFGHYERSEFEFTKAIEYNPNVPQFYVYRSRARYFLHRQEDARADIAVALYLNPEDEDALNFFYQICPNSTYQEVLHGVKETNLKTDDFVIPTSEKMTAPSITKQVVSDSITSLNTMANSLPSSSNPTATTTQKRSPTGSAKKGNVHKLNLKHLEHIYKQKIIDQSAKKVLHSQIDFKSVKLG
eukprot:Nk52_evm18s296 gene=Nk52_evmTU18s296